MRIKVTQDNIDHGLRGSCHSDPVALALQDVGFIKPYVGPREIRVYGRQNVVFDRKVSTPLEVLAFLEQFDNSYPGQAVKPFDFEFEVGT